MNMIPSVIVRNGPKAYAVVYVYEASCKRDTLGRRIRGRTRYRALKGLFVYDMANRNGGVLFEGETDRHAALAAFLKCKDG